MTPNFKNPAVWCALILSIVLSIGIFRGRTSIKDFFALRKSRDILAKTVDNLEKGNEDLKEELTRIKKSKSYARKVLRDKYHITDDDETILFFPD